MSLSFISGENAEGLPLSEAVRAGDLLFVSGMVGFGPDGAVVSGGVTAETDQIMRDLSDILARSGTTLEKIVKVSVFLTDASDFQAFNDAYMKHFPGRKPARVGIVSGLTIDAKVEMDFIAYVGD